MTQRVQQFQGWRKSAIAGFLAIAFLAISTGLGAVEIPVPPAGHPRVFFREGDLPALRERMTQPFYAKSWRQITEQSKRSFPPLAADQAANYDPAFHAIVESCALRFALTGDEELGRKAITILREVLPAVTYPDQQDITRAKGLTILSAALVYDWCYPLLTAADKAAFITQIKRIAKLTEMGYPPKRDNAVVGHGGEAQLMREQMAAGIAVHDEDPEIFRFAATRFFAEFVPARDSWYEGEWHHQGSSYGPYRFQWEMFASWIFKRMAGVDVFSAKQSQVPYSWLYARRPDGAYLADGDGTLLSKRKTDPAFPSFSDLLTAHYYRDPVLNGVVMRDNQRRERLSDSIWYFLLVDAALGTQPVEALPLARYFPEPAGRLLARTGWAEGATAPTVVAEMKISPWMYNNHQHLDAGHFQLWYKGVLASDSGVYQGQGGGYGSAHDLNYHKRTIAHNTLTVFDPNEVVRWGKQVVATDGGQLWPANGREPLTIDVLPQAGHRAGTVLTHAIQLDPTRLCFSHLSGEIAPAYGPKVERFIRSFVFLPLPDPNHPAVLLVYDRVRAAQASFAKTWMLHAPDRPELAATSFRTHGAWGGRMDAQVLLPAGDDAVLTAVGGEGHEFEVRGVNYPQPPRKGTPEEYENYGWRIELSPREARADDRFLVAIQVGDDLPSAQPLPVELMRGDGWIGVRIAQRLVVFPNGYDSLSTLRISLPEATRVLVTGAVPGQWTVSGGSAPAQATVLAEAQTLTCDLPSGEALLQRNAP